MFVQTWDSRGRDLVEGGWFNISFIRFVVFSLNLVERDCKLHLCFLPLVQWWRILIWCQKYRLIATLKMWNKLWRSYSTHSTRAALYESFNKTWLCITVKYSSIWCDGTNTDDWFVPLGWRQTSVLFLFPPQPYDSLPTSQTCFFQLRLPPYSSQAVMAERLRYAINNCRSIDMDNYMLSRNVDNAEGSDTDYWSGRSSRTHTHQ